MKTISIAAFLAIAASTSTIGSAYERKLSDERRLGMGKYSGDASSKFAKYLDIYDRCCAPSDEVLMDEDKTKCRCPVRTFEGWGDWFNFKAKWEMKCDSTILAKSSIVALAKAEGFDELVGLLAPRQDLVNLLKSNNGGKGWTVFAPTDAAFQDLSDKVPDLTDDEVTDVLKYHVVADTVPATALSDDQEVTTANGKVITIDLVGGVFVEDGTTVKAKVGPKDVFASNGVVHVIDKVLIPPGFRSQSISK